MEKVAERKSNARIKKDDYMVRYDYNPLSEKENERQNHSRSKKKQLQSSLSAHKLSPFAKEIQMKESVGLMDAL